MNRITACSTLVSGAFKSFRVAASSFSALALLFAAPSFAGTIDYAGPMVGPGGETGWMSDSVWFLGVSESNSDTVQRFGAPTGVGNDAIDFTPVDFVADIQSADASTSEIVDSVLSFSVVAKPNNSIDDLSFAERGFTQLVGLGGASAYSSVTAHFIIDIVEVDGLPVGGTQFNIDKDMVFTPSDGDYELGVDGTTAYNTVWRGDVMVDVRQHLIDQGIDFSIGATKLNVLLENTLTAAANDGGSALINKQDFDGVTITVNVPEPTSLVLAGMVLVGIAGVRRFAVR